MIGEADRQATMPIRRYVDELVGFVAGGVEALAASTPR